MKQKEKSAISKRKIIDAAMQLFSLKGYDETSMDEIIALSETSKGGVYHHFKSKQHIMETMIEDTLQKVNQHARELAENDTLEPQEKISLLIRYFAKNQAHEHLIKSKWIEKVPFAFLHTTRNTLQTLTDYIEVIIRQGIQKGEYVCAYPREIASTLLLFFDIWLDPLIVMPSAEDINTRIDFIAEFLNNFHLPLLGETEISELKSIYTTYCEQEN